MGAMQKIDIGCGNNKAEGFYGVDQFPFDGVDKVFDLSKGDWPLSDSQFDYVRASHVIEHVKDTQVFLKEIHRIAKDGSEVLIETPHYSWVDSWNDPTHVWHFSSGWARCLEKGQYLSYVTGEFKILESRIEFNSSFRSIIPRLLSKLFGQESYEKHYAFIFPARNIHTRLQVVKK